MTPGVGNPPLGEAISETSPKIRWFVLFLAWAAVTLTFVDRLAWASVAVDAGNSLEIPIAALGVFVTAFYVGYVISNVLGGLLTDRFGAERVMVACLVPHGIVTFLFGYTDGISMGLVLQLLMGLTAGSTYSVTVKLITAWFDPAERGRAMGLLTSANSFGLVLANAFVPMLSVQFGWSGAYRILGVVATVVALIAFALLRANRRPAPGMVAAKLNPLVIFEDRTLTLLALVGFCAIWGTWGTAFWANALMTQRFGLSAIEAGKNLALFGAAGMIAKPLIGFVLDWLGPAHKKSVAIASLGTFALALFLYGSISNVELLRWATPALGVVAFIYTPVLYNMVTDAAGLARTGTAIGVTNAIWQLGSVVVPIAVGLIYSATSSFQAAFLLLGAGPLLATVLMMIVPKRDRYAGALGR